MLRRRLALVVLVAMIAGCDSGNESASPVAAPSPAEDLRRGELLSYACQACHTLARGGSHQVGPNLFGVFGRVAGTTPGFDFSTALGESGLVWSPDALDRWLADPAGFLPGTTMAFTGYQMPADRAALIEYLVAATGP